MTGSETETLVRRFFAEVLATRDMATLRELCGSDYVWHGSSDPEDDVVGLEPFAQSVAGFFESFPECGDQVLDVIARAIARRCASARRGRTRPRSWGSAPTGRRVRCDGIAIYRAQDGRLVEEWSVGDSLSLLRQLGAVVSIDGVEL